MFWRNIYQEVKGENDKKKTTEKVTEYMSWPENKNILKIS